MMVVLLESVSARMWTPSPALAILMALQIYTTVVLLCYPKRRLVSALEETETLIAVDMNISLDYPDFAIRFLGVSLHRPGTPNPAFPGVRVNQMLLPDFSSTNWIELQEADAARFLSKYCPDAMEIPSAVPIRSIMEKQMGLTVITDKKIVRRKSSDGAALFREEAVTVLDEMTGEEETVTFPKGTVIIDYDVFWKKGYGSMNYAVVHETYEMIVSKIASFFLVSRKSRIRERGSVLIVVPTNNPPSL